jgi:hypothetical protein
MRPVAIALVAAALFATPALTQKTEGPDTLSRDWKRLTTPNLTVVGNARDSDLRRAAEEIERFRGSLATLSSALRLDSPLPVTVVVFRDDSAFDPFKPRDRGKVRDDVAGYFLSLPHANFHRDGADRQPHVHLSGDVPRVHALHRQPELQAAALVAERGPR